MAYKSTEHPRRRERNSLVMAAAPPKRVSSRASAPPSRHNLSQTHVEKVQKAKTKAVDAVNRMVGTAMLVGDGVLHRGGFFDKHAM